MLRKSIIISPVLLILLTACGAQGPGAEPSLTKDEVHACKRPGSGPIYSGAPSGVCQVTDEAFSGWARCVGNGGLAIRNAPSRNAELSSKFASSKGYCAYGTEAYVEGLVWNSNDGTYYAKLPGWGDYDGYGYADYRWLQKGLGSGDGHGKYP